MTKTAVVIGAGPAGLSAAEILAQSGIITHVYERNANPARKFLMAGRGGLNLTHSEDFCRFLTRYGEASARLRPFLEAFGPTELRSWCEGLEQQTFIGSSGRVFPKAFKASPLLRAWLRRLAGLGVTIHLNQKFQAFDGHKAGFTNPDGISLIEADAYVLALGGASWPRLGADGAWVEPLQRVGLEARPLRPPIAVWRSAGQRNLSRNLTDSR
jgi:predicted Rossmann fold flavoprotein